MTAPALTFADERRARRNVERSRKTYAAALAALDLAHAGRVLAAEHADRMSGAAAPVCRCAGGWTDDGFSCGRCGRSIFNGSEAGS
ncbi:hypothetical protein [Solirubrobacter soli]|uniref:hypothetical protein n=1 Tax=Solirubrobacter soli TaxID=363832 RepID=UPI000416DEDE|nr:hypothetical protein [Solirubrobacter soli]